MKVAVSTYGVDLAGEIDPRFGRCENILVVDTDTNDMEVVPNTNKDLGGGAGIQTASLVVAKGVKAVITGSCGPNAMDVFTSSSVEVYTGQAGSVGQAIERFNRGELTPSQDANAPEKAGIAGTAGTAGAGAGVGNGGSGAGGGGGCRGAGGTGMGMGRGGGRGRGMGQGMGRRR